MHPYRGDYGRAHGGDGFQGNRYDNGSDNGADYRPQQHRQQQLYDAPSEPQGYRDGNNGHHPQSPRGSGYTSHPQWYHQALDYQQPRYSRSDGAEYREEPRQDHHCGYDDSAYDRRPRSSRSSTGSRKRSASPDRGGRGYGGDIPKKSRSSWSSSAGERSEVGRAHSRPRPSAPPALSSHSGNGSSNSGDNSTAGNIGKPNEKSHVRCIRLLEIELRRLRQLVPKPTLRQPKLLVLDLNGFLVYRLRVEASTSDQHKPEPTRPHDKQEGGFRIWLRPHARSFLAYLLQHFHVAVWSSALLRNVMPLLHLLLDDAEEKLAFVWSQHECTKSGQHHPKDSRRPLFRKEIAKIFNEPSFHGMYTAQNTLLIDDDASKAALNPPHTCINPATYVGQGEQEDRDETRGGLAPDGGLRQWLDLLLQSSAAAPPSSSSSPLPSSGGGSSTAAAAAAAAAATATEGDAGDRASSGEAEEVVEHSDIPSFVAENCWPPLSPTEPDPSEITLGSEEDEED